MNPLVLFVIIFGILFAVLHGVDLASAIDLTTGLCTSGSVWLRYIALGVSVAIALAVGYTCRSKPEKLCGRHKSMGVLSVAAAVCFALAGALRLVLALTGIGAIVRAVLEILCAVWMLCMGRSWLHSGDWKLPAHNMVLAVAGSAVFYWHVLSRFMENSSSWHRVIPTAAVWQALAALIFLAALARALCLPGTSNSKMLCASALATFYLCLCWELPQAVMLFAAGQTTLPALMFSLGMCCVGAIGGCCAVSTLRK